MVWTISTIIYVGKNYHEYHGGEENERGLLICGYELVLMANLLASYLFMKYKSPFLPKIYHEIYRDDGLVIFKVKNSAQEIKYWLNEFHKN